MNMSDIRLPRQLEADGTAEPIRQALMVRTTKLWSGGHLAVPIISMHDLLKKALQTARLMGHMRYGFEAILEKLDSEKAGLTHLRKIHAAPHGDRVSRLLLFSSDGAERLYRHIERLLQIHDPRLLGCLLDIDSLVLGRLLTDQDRRIKIVMLEHKSAVSQTLRTLVPEPDPPAKP